MALARANPKEPGAQGEVVEAAIEQAKEEEPTPHEAEARELARVEAPSVTKATKAEAAEAGVPRTTKAMVAEAETLGTTEAGATEAGVSTAKPAAQEVEMEAGQASILPLVQGPPPSQESAQEVEVHSIFSDKTSREKGVADAEAGSAVEQPAPTSGEGSSTLVRVVLEAKIEGHNTLRSATRTAYDALEVEGVQLGSSLRSRLIALSGQVHERLRGALHTGIKRALAIIASHYIGVDLEAVNDGYVLAKDDEEADEVVAKLMEVVEGPSTALAKLFKEEVVPPMPSANAGDPEP
ncbi:uncharacterized protein [Miscanthus floridulus]|uniref:uncharacterized protein n=1 Tax=Miscanthus floridulus TaxID=154761 RepID=UPI003459B4C3